MAPAHSAAPIGLALRQPTQGQSIVQARLKLPLLAVATTTSNSVGMFSTRGKPLERRVSDRITHPSPQVRADQLAWHPTKLILAVGWSDSSVGFYAFTDDGHFHYKVTCAAHHRGALSVLAWTPNGTRVIVGDVEGGLSVWRIQRHGDLAMDWDPVKVEAATRQLPGRPSHLVFEVASRSPSTAAQLLTQQTMTRDLDLDSADLPPTSFFLAVTKPDGQVTITYGDDHGALGDLFHLDDTQGLHKMFFYARAHQLVCISSSNMMTVHARGEGAWSIVSRMRFSSSSKAVKVGAKLHAAWAGSHTLVSASPDDAIVRIFNFETQGNYTLELPDISHSAGSMRRSPDTITALAYHARDNCLAIGTLTGSLHCFQHLRENSDADGEVPGDDDDLAARNWRLQPHVQATGAVTALALGASASVLAAISATSITVCEATQVQRAACAPLLALQSASQQVSVHSLHIPGCAGGGGGPGDVRRAQVGEQVTGLALSASHLVVSSASALEVFSISAVDAVRVGTLPQVSAPCGIALLGDTIYRCVENRVEAVSTAGAVKEVIEFPQTEGAPAFVAVNSTYMAVLTASLYLHVYNMKGRKARETSVGQVQVVSKSVYRGSEDDDAFGPPVSVQLSCDGKNVALLFAALRGAPGTHDGRILVHDCDGDAAKVLDLRERLCEPRSLLWASDEGRLLVAQVRTSSDSPLLAKGGPNALLTICLADDRLLMHDVQPLDPGAVAISLQSPVLAVSVNRSRQQQLQTVTLSCFTGMEESDASTRSALLAFTLHMATGNTDAAHKAMRAIKSPAVWESMATVCVKSGNLPVLQLCLANMENVRGARALRAQEAKHNSDAEAKLGVVAIHLGLEDDACSLFKSAERWDLLNSMYQSMGRWDDAIATATEHDRIHLKATHFKYAQQLERMGDTDGAITHYEAAGRSAQEVPRLIIAHGGTAHLKAYVQAHKQAIPELLRWWASYCASQGLPQKAMECWEELDDVLAQVKLLCAQQDYSGAKERVMDSGHKGAAFYLARRLEMLDQPAEAILFYGMAKRYSVGASLARRHGLSQELQQLAMQSDRVTQLKTAEYFLTTGESDRAAALFQAAGAQDRAVQIAMDQADATGDNSALALIAAGLGADSGISRVQMLEVAEKFKAQGQWTGAVNMLVGARCFRDAADLCAAHGVPLTDDLAEKLSPEKGTVDEEERLATLRRVAKAARKQGAFQLAAKKYAQAGDRVKAMKSLLCSHDTEKIVLFANVSRQRELFLLAAQYLQSSQAWLHNEGSMKQIVALYTKAKSHEHLSSFFEACAMAEIDECRDYKRASVAMQEALKHLGSAGGKRAPPEDAGRIQDKADSLTARLKLVHDFLHAQALATDSADQSLAVCQQLLQDVPGEGAEREADVRAGDVYGLVVETYARKACWAEALRMVEDMEARGIQVKPYVDEKTVEEVYRRNGVERASAPVYVPPGRGANVDTIGDDMEMEEEIGEGDDDAYMVYARREI